jgi:hypothetical protein
MTWVDAGSRGASEGTFTAAAPLCSSGTWKDIGGTIAIKTRHTCADGTGTFDFEVSGVGTFHFGAGSTGRYKSLRGKGSCSIVQGDDGSFTRSCHALADFDSTPPTVAVKSLDVLYSGRGFNLQAAFTTKDNVAPNAVKYRVSVSAAGRALSHATGTTPGGLVRVSLRARLPKRARRFTVSVRVADPLGNARTVARSMRLPR